MKKESKKQTSSAAANKKNQREISSDQTLTKIQGDLTDALQKILSISDDKALSRVKRLSLFGSGVKRYGFVKKTLETANANTGFAPPFLDFKAFNHLAHQLEEVRNVDATLQQLLRANTDLLLLLGDEMYRFALMYYGAVRDASHRRVPGAWDLFQMLRPYFAQKHRTRTEPTQHQVEKDVHALLKGVKDGEIVIKNERPKTVEMK
jgi:hypothetical protein